MFFYSVIIAQNWAEEEIDKLPNTGLQSIKTSRRYQTQSLHDANTQNQSQLKTLNTSSPASIKPVETSLEYVVNILSEAGSSEAVTDIRSWRLLTGRDGWNWILKKPVLIPCVSGLDNFNGIRALVRSDTSLSYLSRLCPSFFSIPSLSQSMPAPGLNTWNFTLSPYRKK